MRHLEPVKENIKYIKKWKERKEEGDFSICVWAINKEFIKKCFIRIIKVPSHDNDFLYAQEGLFLYKYDIENGDILVGLNKEHKSFLQNTNDFLKLINYHYKNEENKPIKKLTLSISENMINELNKCPDHLDNEEIVKFLKLLMKENITKSSLMPTFEMVVENLKMRGHLKEWWKN
ncbi:MAG: hypothetical protein PVI26_04060 [Chitinispirillia bacterium]|jgi:hypothetical protein